MGTVKKQKRARKGALKNRYCAGAKLSEHKFLRLLHGYAQGLTINELERTTHVSSKTIRATYRALRAHLPNVIKMHPDRFSGVGLLLNYHGAPALIHALRHSPLLRRYRRRHAPRLKCPDEELEYIHEIAARLMCALDLRDTGLREDETAVRDVVLSLVETIPRLSPRAPLQKLAELVPGAKPFAHPELRFYEDYRRHLLKQPLGTR